MQKLNNSEIKVTEVISFILGQFRDERVDHDLEHHLQSFFLDGEFA